MSHKSKLTLFITQVVIILTIHNTCYSQVSKNYIVSGNIVDSLNNAIPYASICLYKPQSDSLLGATLSDSTGHFDLLYPKNGSFRLDIRCFSFYPKTINIQIVPEKDSLNLRTLTLAIHPFELEGVTITSNKSRIEYHVDKMVFNPDSFSIKKSVSGADLLKHIPNVNVSPIDKTVSVKGNKNVLILVNGRSSDKDISTIHASEIKKVEVITSPSTRYQSDTENVINIILKEKKKEGIKVVTNLESGIKKELSFGTIALDYGSEKARYFVKYNTSAQNLSYADSSYQKESYNSYALEYLSFPIENQTFDVLSHKLEYGFDYIFNAKNFLNITCNYSNQDSNEKSYNGLNSFIDRSLSSSSFSVEKSKSNIVNQNYSFFYKRNFNNPNHEIWLSSNIYLLNRIYKSEHSHGNLDLPNEVNQWDEKTMNDQISNNTEIEYFYQNNQIKLESGYQLYTRFIENKYSSLNDNNEFSYNDTRNALFTNFTFKKKNLSIQGGIRFEAKSYSINSIKNDLSVYPLLSFNSSFNLKDHQSLRLTYNRRLSYPNYRLLVPFEYFSADSLNSKLGNSNLSPTKTDKIELVYSLGKDNYSLSLSGMYKVYTDYISTLYKLEGGAISGQTVNFSRIKSSGSELSFSVYLDFLELNLDGSLFYLNFPNNEYNGFSHDLSTELIAYLPLDFTIGAIFELFNEYRYPSSYMIVNNSMDYIYLNKALFKNKGELKLYWMYPCYSDKSTQYIWSNHFEKIQYSNGKNSIFGIGFSYFFDQGKKIKKGNTKLNMEHDEEKK